MTDKLPPNYIASQARGFAQRHGGAIVDVHGSLDGSGEGDTAGGQTRDLSSPGEVDRNADVRSQIRQTSVDGTGVDDVAGKAAKCDHHLRTFKVDGSVLCHECKTTWSTQLAFQKELQQSERSNALVKSAESRQRCDMQPRYLPMSKSARSLSQTLRTAYDGTNASATRSDHSLDRERDELSKKLFATAARETNPLKKALLEKLAAGIDSGRFPVPSQFRSAVRLSTGLPMRKSGSLRQGERFMRRHGFGG